jgi:hypothetical protein
MPVRLATEALLRVCDSAGRVVRSEVPPVGTELHARLRIAHENYARQGLAMILDTIRLSSGGQAARLVRFLASLYLKYDCPFELTDLRTLDTKLANARLDYFNYDRLGVCDLDRHLADGGAGRHAPLCQRLERLLEQGALARWIETQIDAVRRDIDAD